MAFLIMRLYTNKDVNKDVNKDMNIESLQQAEKSVCCFL